MKKFTLAVLLSLALLSPNASFASTAPVPTSSLQSLIALLQSLQAQLNALKAAPTITVQAVTPTQVRFAYANLPSNTSVYLVSSMSPFTAYKMSSEFGSVDSVVRSIPSAILNLDSSTQYRIEARDQYGATKATSEYFQAGGYPADIPGCTITASDYDVKGGDSVTLKWTSSGAQAVYKSVGFSDDPQMSSLGKNSSLTIQPTISGSLVYGLVFGAASGNQSICEVFVHVTGSTQSGSIDVGSLSSESTHPILTGTATNVSTVKVFITARENGAGLNWVSNSIGVKDGKWLVTVNPPLVYENYTYDVELNAYDKGQYFKLADGKLYVK